MLKIETWDDCIKRYEFLKQTDHWNNLATAMLSLIDRIRRDKDFPQTLHIVSHAWLRIGPRIDNPTYLPSVWIGWRKPNYYWIGVGSFGTQRRITVTTDRVIPMLKRYLKLLNKIDPVYAQFVPPEPEPEPMDEWATDLLKIKYDHLRTTEVLPQLAQDLDGQVNDVKQFSDQLREVLGRLEQIDEAQAALDEILKRADRISKLLSVGIERAKASQQSNFSGMDMPTINQWLTTEVQLWSDDSLNNIFNGVNNSHSVVNRETNGRH